MVILLDSTKSGEFANSYVTTVEADDYFSGHYNSTFTTAWDALDDSQKQLLLIQATSMIEQFRFVIILERSDFELHYSRTTGLVSFYPKDQDPIKYNYWQALQFPRSVDINSVTGATYIPDPIKIAQFEQAMSIKNFASSTNITKVMQGIRREAVEIAGQISRDVTYADGASNETTIITNTLSPVSYQLISPYVLRGSRVKRS